MMVPGRKQYPKHGPLVRTWKAPDETTWRVETVWAEFEGHAVCVSLHLRSVDFGDDSGVVTELLAGAGLPQVDSTRVRRLPVGAVLDDARESIASIYAQDTDVAIFPSTMPPRQDVAARF